MRKYLFPLAAAAVLAGAGQSFAASSSTTFNVQVTIATACTVGATAMNFGTINTVTGAETATSNVSINCNKGTAYGLSFTNAATIAAATTSTGLNLNNGANVIPATLNISGGATGIALGTSANTGTVTGQLTATPFPVAGAYSNIQTLYVIY